MKELSSPRLPDGFEPDEATYPFVASHESEAFGHRGRTDKAIRGILRVIIGKLSGDGGNFRANRFHHDA